MTKTKIPNIEYDATEKNLLVDHRLRICVECGQTNVENYEFGISCENCGTLLIFDPLKISRNYFGVET